MLLPLRCRCGKVRGEIDADRVYARGVCYCKDCQAYARFLGGDGLTDDKGGTDILPMAPSGIAIAHGRQHLACMSLGPKGLLRWYARCCRTPLANTPRDPKVAYAGVPAVAIDATAAQLGSRFGARDALVLNTGSALGKVRPTRVAFARAGFAILRGILRERFSGRARLPTPFFDGQGAPTAKVEVLGRQRRAELTP